MYLRFTILLLAHRIALESLPLGGVHEEAARE